MKILIADDSAVARALLKRCLTDWGHEVIEAVDGIAAWAELTGPKPPRVAILDWVMPGLNGVEICRKLLARPGRPLIYTILLTAKDAPDDLVAALECGAHSFLSKPFSAPVLRAQVQIGQRLVAAEDTLAGYASQMESLAEARAFELVRAEHLARTDSLTGLPNRRGFEETASRELRRSQRYDHPLAILAIDADHFKRVNDTLGHHAGDEVLRALGRTLVDSLRECDAAGRVGGEEFVVLLAEADPEAALEAAERLRRSVERQTVVVGGHSARVTISVGIGCRQPRDSSIEAIMARADAALYCAKRAGRNQTSVGDNPASRPYAGLSVVPYPGVARIATG